jgi:hypothetical protein
MRKMSRKKFLRWEKLRLKGKRYFVARTAVLSGVFFFVTMNLASWLWSGMPLSSFFILAYPLLGLLTGTVLWSVNEERFEEFIAAKNASVRRRG